MLSIRLALRHLATSPTFAIVAVLSLMLGIGPTTAIFSLVDEILLRSLPVSRPDELVLFRAVHGAKGSMSRGGEGPGGVDPATGRQTGTPFSLAIFERLAGTPAPVASVFAFAPFSRVTIIVDGVPETTAAAQYVSGGYYAGLGVRPALGRLVAASDDRAAAPPVAVISHRFWMRRFEGRTSAVGATIFVNKVPATIVGVSAAGFDGAQQAGETADVSVPLAHFRLFQPDRPGRAEPGYWWVRLMARLAPGATPAQARAALEPAFQAAARDAWEASGRAAADRPDDPRLALDPGAQGETDRRQVQQRPLLLMLALAGVVLVAACVNVSTLLAVRGTHRRREFGLRLALRASRLGIIGQCVVESLLLGGGGAAAGIALAWAGRGLLRDLNPFGSTNVVLDLPLDARVLAVTIGVSVGCAVVFGLVPALSASRVDLSSTFRGGPRTLGAGGRSWLARVLLVVQVALSVVLLVSAGLFARTVTDLDRVDAGFDQRGLALFRIDAVSSGYAIDASMALHERIHARVTAIPGVTGVTYSRVALLSRRRSSWSMSLTGAVPTGPTPNVNTNGVAPDFFAVMRLPLLRGRAFAPGDRHGAPPVAIVNQTFVRQYLGGADPIGRRLYLGAPKFTNVVEIVGVAKDAKYTDLRGPTPATIYLPSLQVLEGVAAFAVRTSGDPAAALAAIQAAVREIDPLLPVLDLRTQSEQVARLHGPERLFARLSAFFGVTALLLVAVGLHGLLAHVVQRRTGEIGLRLAVGALPAQMRRMIVLQAVGLAAAGAAAGLALAALASRSIASMLFGVERLDPLTYGGAAVALIAVAALASLVAASRAAGIEPLTALKTE